MAFNNTDSVVIGRVPCPECRSQGGDSRGDNLVQYDDGHAYCYSCGYLERNHEAKVVPLKAHRKSFEMSGSYSSIKDRKISQSITQKFNVTVEYDDNGNVVKHNYPYQDKTTGDIVGKKVRVVDDKQFFVSGTLENTGLFGQNVWREGGKYVTVTEGELDALAVAEMFDGKWPVVSLKTGSGGAKRDIQASLEWLETFDNVILCFDMDEPGKKAAAEVLPLFSYNKVKTVSLPCKDAGEMLEQGKVKEFISEWWNAKPYRPEGIINGADLYDEIINFDPPVSIPYPWECLNELTMGFRPQELVTLTSGSGMGKSSVVRELCHYLIGSTTDNIGIMGLEEANSVSGKGLMSIEASIPLHELRTNKAIPKEDRDRWFQATLGTERFYFMNHFGSTSEGDLLSKLRYMIKGMECKWVVIDHLSIIVSDQDNNDERKAIDSIMTKLRTIVQETGVGMFLVSHLKRPDGKAHEDGGQISLAQLRGSASIAQLSDIVIGLERNQQHEDAQERNTTTVRVLKNRFTGLTGPACYLYYDPLTGRLTQISNPHGVGEDGEF
jgi:twinkle protein